MANNKKVVIVGGGFAGCKLAHDLGRQLGFDVTLLSQSSNFEYHGALYRSATGHSPTEVVIPIDQILKHTHNVNFELDTIERIVPKDKRLVSSTGNTYHYDIAVLAMGNQINYFGIDGMEQNSFGMTSMHHAIALRNYLKQLFRGAKQDNTIAIVGAGPTGVELAGEVQHFARMVAHKYRGRVHHPKVVLIEGSDRVLPMFDPVLSAKAYKRLKKLGVTLRLNTKVNACEPGKVCVDSGDIDADAIVWTAGSRPVDFYGEHPKVFTLEKARVKVDKYLRADGHDDIFVLGDNALTPHTGMAQTALYDARFLARNLLRQHSGQAMVSYRARHPVYVVPIGPNWAVYQDQKHQLSGYVAWLMRRRADRAIFKNFLSYKQAIKQWRKGNKIAQF